MGNASGRRTSPQQPTGSQANPAVLLDDDDEEEEEEIEVMKPRANKGKDKVVIVLDDD